MHRSQKLDTMEHELDRSSNQFHKKLSTIGIIDVSKLHFASKFFFQNFHHYNYNC
jgi:hypothetical protein